MEEKKTTESQALAVRELPEPVSRRGITEPQWLTLANNLYPGANPKSVLMVWDYCAARKLDPMKKPVHIVPMRIKNAATGDHEWRDVVMPGIYEYRITAQRTGEYLGHSAPEYGPEVEFMGVKAPEWCAMTVYRLNRASGLRVEFPVRVYFREVVGTKTDKDKVLRVNERWTRAPIQMMTKCAEAAGTREAFPEETGGEPTAEEMEGQHVIVDVTPQQEPAAVSLLDRLPEALRDTVEKAFETLALAPGLRLVKLNEFLGKEDVTFEDGAAALLTWCRDEYAKRKTGQPVARSNNKTSPTPAAAATSSSVAAVASSAVDPKRGDSDARPSGAEVLGEVQTTPQAPKIDPSGTVPTVTRAARSENQELF